jgi:hypothetical protein
MNRSFFWGVIACLSLFGPAAASDVTSAVQHWMGKWPAIPFNRQPDRDWSKAFPEPQPNGSKDGRTFWQFTGTRAGFEQAVGKRRAALLIGKWHTGGPLEMVGKRWANFSACKPHDCGDNIALVFVDTLKGTFNVCWTETARNGQTRAYWMAPNQEPQPLAADACNLPDSANLAARYAH